MQDLKVTLASTGSSSEFRSGARVEETLIVRPTHRAAARTNARRYIRHAYLEKSSRHRNGVEPSGGHIRKSPCEIATT
jgi:hypothetical protein